MMEKKGNLIFLGTGTSQGVPPIGCDHPVCLSNDPKDQRLRTSALLQVENKNFVIDCGPDFRQQMLRVGIKDLEAIVFTHEHNDHVSGLDDIRPFYFLQGGKPFPLYCPQSVLKSIQTRFAYFFYEKKYPGVPEVNVQIVNDEHFNIGNIVFEPIPIIHGKESIYGYRVGNLVYITDASFIPEDSLTKMKGCDVLVLNALRKEPEHYSHFTLSQALEIVEKVQPKEAYFTHISHYMGFHEEVQQELPDHVYLAYDGLQVAFGL